MKDAGSEEAIASALIDQGKRFFAAAKKPVEFAKDPAADALINDLTSHPHAFVLGCVVDRQVKSEVAWRLPHRLAQRLGTFRFERLAQLDRERMLRLLTEPDKLHRFPAEMASNLLEAITLIRDGYAGDASRIWSDNPASGTVVYRFLQFRGVGPKIAAMAANLLACHFKIPMSDYASIDVAVDVHVRRVLARLRLIRENATEQEIIYRCRGLSPEFPGICDSVIWEIGKTWCRPKNPKCADCVLSQSCPTARGV